MNSVNRFVIKVRSCAALLAAAGLMLLCVAGPARAASSVYLYFDNGNIVQSATHPSYAYLSDTNLGGTAWGEADAAAGTIRAYLAATPTNTGIGSFPQIVDTFTLHGIAAGSPVNLTAYLAVNGTLWADSVAQYAPVTEAYVETRLQAPGSGPGSDYFSAYTRDPVEKSDCYLYGCPAAGVVIDTLRSIPLTVAAGSPFDVHYSVNLGAINFAIADFAATASLGFALPVGTSISSSGGFSQVAPIPVPAAAWLFGTGLLGLLAAAGRRTA